MISIRRGALVALVVSLTGAGLAGCAGSGSTSGAKSSTSTTAIGPSCSKDGRAVVASAGQSQVDRLPVATLRTRYLAIAGPSNKVFAKFSNQLAGLSSATTSAQMKAAVYPALTAITTAANGFWCLHLASPPKLATAFRSAAVDDDVVYQALVDLAANYGKRSFDVRGWGANFRQAAVSANAAGSVLRKTLGLA